MNIKKLILAAVCCAMLASSCATRYVLVPDFNDPKHRVLKSRKQVRNEIRLIRRFGLPVQYQPLKKHQTKW
jgi:hypothetical protein